MTKKYIEEFKHAQEEWKRKEREAMEEENRRILAFANVQKEREEAQKAEKQARYDNIIMFLLFASILSFDVVISVTIVINIYCRSSVHKMRLTTGFSCCCSSGKQNYVG